MDLDQIIQDLDDISIGNYYEAEIQAAKQAIITLRGALADLYWCEYSRNWSKETSKLVEEMVRREYGEEK